MTRILDLHAAEGGADAADLVGLFAAMYDATAINLGWKVG